MPNEDVRQPFIQALAKYTVVQQNDMVASQQQNDAVATWQPLKWSWTWDDGLLFLDNLIYVPDDALCLEIKRMHHDDTLVGHYGTAKMLELLSRNYHFPGMSAYVKKYVKTCDICT